MGTLACVSTDQFALTDRLMKWQELMSVHVGKTPEKLRRLESTRFQSLEGAPFAGRLEYGELGDMHFCRMVSTPIDLPAASAPRPANTMHLGY